MLNKIVDGIIQQILLEFGNEYRVYTENVEQGLVTPCFLLTSLNSIHNAELGSRYNKTHPFSVQYFPVGAEPKAECHGVYDRLSECLEYISTDEGLLRYGELSGQIEDDVLTVTVSYKVLVFKGTAKDNEMSEMKVISNVRGDEIGDKQEES